MKTHEDEPPPLVDRDGLGRLVNLGVPELESDDEEAPPLETPEPEELEFLLRRTECSPTGLGYGNGGTGATSLEQDECSNPLIEFLQHRAECRDSQRAQPSTPEAPRSGGRESPFRKWGSPSKTDDSSEFHLVDTDSSKDQVVFPLTIEQGDKQDDTPLHSVSWKDESHPMWVRIRTVMDSGAADSVAPPTLAPT